jgi:hypothetical protein
MPYIKSQKLRHRGREKFLYVRKWCMRKDKSKKQKYRNYGCCFMTMNSVTAASQNSACTYMQWRIYDLVL